MDSYTDRRVKIEGFEQYTINRFGVVVEHGRTVPIPHSPKVDGCYVSLRDGFIEYSMPVDLLIDKAFPGENQHQCG